MERRAKVELFEQIRREYEFGNGTIRGVADQLGVHRRMVRQALASAEPPERKRVKRERPAIGPVQPFIDAILEADRTAPRKQRHTAHRIYNGSGASYQSTGWRRQRCACMCANANTSWAGRPARPAYRRVTRRAGKVRSIGTRRGRSSVVSRSSCRCSRCAA